MLLFQMLIQRKQHHHGQGQGCYMILIVFGLHLHIFWSMRYSFPILPIFRLLDNGVYYKL